MSRAWRTILYIVLGLLVAGVVLLGAAWLTGASVERIETLVLGGPGGLRVWLDKGLQSVLDFLSGAWETVRSFF